MVKKEREKGGKGKRKEGEKRGGGERGRRKGEEGEKKGVWGISQEIHHVGFLSPGFLACWP